MRVGMKYLRRLYPCAPLSWGGCPWIARRRRRCASWTRASPSVHRAVGEVRRGPTSWFAQSPRAVKLLGRLRGLLDQRVHRHHARDEALPGQGWRQHAHEKEMMRPLAARRRHVVTVHGVGPCSALRAPQGPDLQDEDGSSDGAGRTPTRARPTARARTHSSRRCAEALVSWWRTSWPEARPSTAPRRRVTLP